jgi:hypothetical protein
MQADWLTPGALWVLFLLFVALPMAATELGFRYGRRVRPGYDEKAISEVGTTQAALLGLLGLLLGFSFAMACTRFDARRQTVVDEANAIGTTYLRAGFLRESGAGFARSLLRDYVRTRLDVYDARSGPAQVAAAERRGEEIQGALWEIAERDEPERRDPTFGLFVQTLNDMIDMDAKRRHALENHVPTAILVLIGLVSTVTLGASGFACGLGLRRNPATMIALPLMVAVVSLEIIDLDRPREGLIRAGHSSMLRLDASLRAPSPR